MGRQRAIVGAGWGGLGEQALAYGIETAVSDLAICQRAAAIGEKIRVEDGVAHAVAVFEQYLQWN